MFGAKFWWTFWPFLPRSPTYSCAVPSNCPELFARTFAWTLPFDEALFSDKKGFSAKRGEAIQWIRGLVRISTRKAIQWRGSGHSLNRRTLKIENLLSSSPSWKSVPTKNTLKTSQKKKNRKVISQKNPRAHKNKIGTPPAPPQNPKYPPPPLKRGILWTWVFPAERTHFSRRPPISGPRIADNNFTDTRTFLNFVFEASFLPREVISQK